MKNFIFLFVLMMFTGCTDDPVQPETLPARDYLRGTWRITYAGQKFDELISTTSTTLTINYVEYTGTYSGRTFKGTNHTSTEVAETDNTVEYRMVTKDSIVGVRTIIMTSPGEVVTTTTAPLTGVRK